VFKPGELIGDVFVISLSLLSTGISEAQTPGCTDPFAINYNSAANRNDGSCIYSLTSVSSEFTNDLAGNLSETSGLISWKNQLWTINDNEDVNLYALDTANGMITKTYPLSGAVNTDWEEIAQDSDYIYIGDFGNNQSGNRSDLKILRIGKNSVLENSPVIEEINFSYPDQNNFEPAGSNNTDFDCEACLINADRIFLFTKQWINNKTSVYSLPKIPGTYSAKWESTFDVQGLITGATWIQSKRLVVLCGYNGMLEPFIYLLYDFTGNEFFSGNKRKISISLPYHQVEGVATTNGLKYFISNEKFTLDPILNVPPQVHVLDLTNFLEDYFKKFALTNPEIEISNDMLIYPVPGRDIITIKTKAGLKYDDFVLINLSGQIILKGKLTENNQQIDISPFLPGLFLLKVGTRNPHYFKVIKD